MFLKTISSLAIAVVLICQIVVGLELIEMNDANKNAMNLDLSKALAGVQGAYQTNFSFEKVKDVRKFIAQCEQISQILSRSKDTDFAGLAGKIKQFMADESIAKPCSVTDSQLADLDELDTGMKTSDHDYLSQGVLNTLVELKKRIQDDEALKVVASHVLRSKASELADALMKTAKDTVNVYLGEVHESDDMFDFDLEPKQLCEHSLIGPICKLVRGTSLNVGVIAKDLDDFVELVESKDASKIERHVQSSGVSMDDLKGNCATINRRRAFKPIRLIRDYVSAGFLDEQQVMDFMKKDSVLASYSSLYGLCTLFI